MKLDRATLDHLTGTTFSNGHAFDLGNRGRASRRFERLIELCRGQRVLHVGCCDHLDLIRDKAARGVYLHQHLCAVARHCVGVDTNAAGVALLREMDFPKVYLPEDVPDDEFDICLLADVIEHVGDVVSFLQSMRRYRFQRIVVVTPNLFRLRNWLSSGEVVNTDHRYWFSPYTLCKVLVDAGYTPQQVELCHGDHVSWRGATAARLLDWLPKYRDTLMVTAAR
ncbi:MAG: methyltransferase domain-containing protein [Burkholderiaceae bacterium]